MNFLDFCAHNATWRSTEIAVQCGSSSTTWGSLVERAKRVGSAIASCGGRESKVAVLASNSVTYIEILLGAWLGGGVLVPLSPLLNAEAVRLALVDSQSSVLFVSRSLAATVASILPQLESAGRRTLVSLDFFEPGFVPYEEFIERGACAVGTPLRVEDAAAIIYSSGTTGSPKGIVHTLAGRTMLALGMAVELQINRAGVVLATTSLASNATWLVALPALLTGARLVLTSGFSPEAFLDLVERESVSHTFLVPAQLSRIVQQAALTRRDLSSLKCVLSAGAPLRAQLKQAIVEHVTANLYELYGWTEGAATIIGPEWVLKKPDSVGRPVFVCDIAIVDESGVSVAAGTAGEVVGRGPGSMVGYRCNPTATEAAIWRDPQGRAWLRSGDIGRLDAEGFLTIIDRKKDMIISGGLNVYPSDIERVLTTHPEVAEAVVIGVDDEKWGETPVAFVILHENGTASAETLRQWINARLSKHQRVAAVEIRRELPRNALGKVLRRELRSTAVPQPDRPSNLKQ